MPLARVAGVLNSVKSADGKIAVSQDTQSLILVDTPDVLKQMEDLVRQIDVQTVTVDMPVRFTRADLVAERVRGLLTPSVGSIAVDVAANNLKVTDLPAAADRIRRAVDAADAQGRKFILEAKLVHIALDDEHINGVDWSGIVADQQIFRLEGAYDFLGGKGHTTALSLGTIEPQDFTPLVDALDTVGLVREYPVVDAAVTAGADVRMTVRFDEPYVTLSPVNGADAEAAVGDPAPAGPVMSFVVRTSTDPVDGTLKTVLVPQEPEQALRLAGVKPLPFNRQRRGATVRSLENATIVIGGLITSEKVAVQRKVPLMGDIPLLGLAFRYSNNALHREEFVILLTAKVVSTGDEVKTDGKANP